MPKLTFKCPLCSKELKLKREFTLGSCKLNEYSCGHIFSKVLHEVSLDNLDFTSTNGSNKHARDYQKVGVKFILDSDFNCIIGDQMRLGKTPQSLLALKNSYKEHTPCLILVRSANLWQWIREYKIWCDNLPNGIFPLTRTSGWIPLGFSAYIVSMDTFSRPKMLEQLKKIPFKLIIADEAHSFKNTESNRSQALVDFVTFLNTGEETREIKFTCNRCKHEWMELGKRTYDKRIGNIVIAKSTKCPRCENYCYLNQQHSERDGGLDSKVVPQIDKLLALGKDQSTTEPERQLALSKAMELAEKNKLPVQKPVGLVLLTGTAIKNRAEELFIPLNLCDPEKFNSLERFRRQWLEQDSKGKYSRIKHYHLDEFKRAIAPIYLRREKEDVYTDLPQLNRTFTVIEPDKETVGKQYNAILDKLDIKLADKVNPSYWDFKEEMMELRQLCALMKVMWLSDYMEASMLEDPLDERYAIGLHHKAVRDILYHKLGAGAQCLKLSGEDSAENKDHVMQEFATSPQRILIMNMVAGGIGMDFHYCNNVIILERMWSAADEEQFEFRFYNPDKSIKTASTNVEYIIAKGTIDEIFFDMVEEKRKIFGETLGTHWSITNDPSSFRELMQRTLGARI